MDNQLAGKVAIVTGGSRGIGRAISQKLSDLGVSVVFNYVADQKSADTLVEEIRKKGGNATTLQADIGVVSEVKEMFDLAISTFGRIDYLVNNAGIATYKKIEEFTEEEFDRIFNINLKGVFFCCRQAARLMADGGVIVNIGSTVTRVMLPTYGAYAATKGAVEQITKVLAKELGPRGIRVNTLSPGPVDTELFRKGKSDVQIEQMGSMAAFGRIGSVDDIANMVTLLIDDRAGWVSGQNILANGGFAA